MGVRWVYRVSDGLFCLRDADDPAKILADPANYAEVEFPDTVIPDPRTLRADPASPTKRRAATAAEISAFDAAALDREAKAKAEKVVKALLGVLFKRTSGGQWPNAAQRQALADDFVTAYKAL